MLAEPIGDQASKFSDAVPGIVDDANAALADLQEWLDDKGIDVEVAKQGETALETLGARVTEGSGELVSFTREALTTVIEGSIALILIVVLSVYMLLYGERIGAVVRSVVPRGDGTPADDYPTRVQRAVFGYVRGQLLFSIIMGTSAGIALWIMGSLGVFPDGKTYALVFGAFYGFAELIPYVGPAIGAGAAGADRAVQRRPARRAVADDHVHRAAADRGPHRRADRLLAGAADQPAAGDLRAADGRPAVRHRRRVPGAAAGRRACARASSTSASTWCSSRGALRARPSSGHAARAAEPAPEPARRCPECGTAGGEEAAAYCSACGTELAGADEAAAAASAAPS